MSDPKVPILVLVSGNGTNLQALLDAEKEGRLGCGMIAAVLSDRLEAYGLKRAEAAGIPSFLELPDRNLPLEERRLELSDRILKRTWEAGAELIALAGFLSILKGALLREYAGRIINLHPSLLPKFGGPGMYGLRVHKAVLNAREKQSGCTVHIVDAGTDTGPIILQRRVPVKDYDSPESLAQRIHGEEHIAIVEAVALMSEKVKGTMKGV